MWPQTQHTNNVFTWTHLNVNLNYGSPFHTFLFHKIKKSSEKKPTEMPHKLAGWCCLCALIIFSTSPNIQTHSHTRNLIDDCLWCDAKSYDGIWSGLKLHTWCVFPSYISSILTRTMDKEQQQNIATCKCCAYEWTCTTLWLADRRKCATE